MKPRIFLVTAIVCGLTFVVNSRSIETQRIGETLRADIKSQLEHRYDKRKVLKAKQFFANNKEITFNDGLSLIGMNRIKSKRKGLSLSVEKLGNDTMVIYRNAKGIAVEAYYCTNREECKMYIMTDDHKKLVTYYIPYLLAGNYMLKNGENSVFGLWQDFYEGSKYNNDPGIYEVSKIEDDSIEITYGNGRVSSGDPKSSKYGKMPGGGGAGAIMGPMIWQVQFTADGLMANVVRDQPFVSHDPSRIDKENNLLTKVQCPWEGVDGKWAFTAVMPLTHELLKLFPKDALELMYAEIFARHGATFKVAKFQKYFNAQKWYKKRKSPTELTDIEKFNAQLINEVILTTDISFTYGYSAQFIR